MAELLWNGAPLMGPYTDTHITEPDAKSVGNIGVFVLIFLYVMG